MEASNQKNSKRPVGRPKLVKPAPEAVSRKGIVSEPIVSNHAHEMVYDKPINLKKIFTLFKLMDTRDVKMEFRLSGVRISDAGDLKHNFIDLTIDSSKLTQYFCKHNIIMILDQKNLEKVIQKIDKSYDSIHFIAKQDSYMKVIGDISKFSDDFTVERRPGTPLAFPYDSNSKTIDVNHIFTRAEVFKIHSTLPDNEFLSTTVRIAYIQSLATALLSDDINVYVDQENMMVFKTTIDDDAFTLLLAVRIVSYK